VLPALAFELASPARIVFGAGAASRIGELAAELGSNALVVTGRSTARVEPALSRLREAGMRASTFAVAGEPTLAAARAGVAAARATGADVIVGFGGGGALDAAKAIGALVANLGDPLDYLEVIGRGQTLTLPSLPCIAVPTTAGTGSEVTRNAVLASPEHGVKASLRSPVMLPRIAIIDPDLLASLPATVIASSGLDALSQLIEPLVSLRANPFTDALAREGIRRSVAALPAAHRSARANAPPTPAARESLAIASLFGGLCLANGGLGAVHGFAAAVGGMFDAPHGAVCAALLPPVVRSNVAALRARAPDSPALPGYQAVAALVTGRPAATAEDGIAFIIELCRSLDVPGLARYGVALAQVPELCAKARVANSMKGNPIALTDAELAEIATAAL
jgi:alcohol dehydrogenase class IV